MSYANLWTCMSSPASAFPDSQPQQKQLWQPECLMMLHIPCLCFPGDPGYWGFDPSQLTSSCHRPPHSCLLLYLLGLELLARSHIPGILNPSQGCSGAWATSATRTPQWGPHICHLTSSQGSPTGGYQSHRSVFTTAFHGEVLSVWWNFRCYFFISKNISGFPIHTANNRNQ